MAQNPIRPTDDDARRLAMTLIRTARSGALATLEPGGFPVSTLVAMATDIDGTPIILVSALSAHTKNLQHDARCSLLLQQTGKGDPLAYPRVSVQTRARVIAADSGDRERVRRRFLSRNPKAALYADFGDFSFMRLEVERASLNGGFGKAFELVTADILTPMEGAVDLVAMEESAVAHMNDDHRDAVRLYATELAGEPDGQWRCIAIDPDGIDLALGDRLTRVFFPARVNDPTGIAQDAEKAG